MTFVDTPNLCVFSGPVAQRALAHAALTQAGFTRVPDFPLEDGTPSDGSRGLPSQTDPTTAAEAGAPNAGHTPGTLHPETGEPYQANPDVAFLTFTGPVGAHQAAEPQGWQLRAHHAPSRQFVPPPHSGSADPRAPAPGRGAVGQARDPDADGRRRGELATVRAPSVSASGAAVPPGALDADRRRWRNP